MAIDSLAGGGAHGHLALVMPAADYLTLAGVAFVMPVHPGAAPTHAAGATGPQITKTNWQYLQDKEIFETYCAVQQELKKKLIAAVPDVYLQTLCNPLFGYANNLQQCS